MERVGLWGARVGRPRVLCPVSLGKRARRMVLGGKELRDWEVITMLGNSRACLVGEFM